MILKSIVLTLFLMAGIFGNAQIDLNDYKYIVVPKRFDGFKNVNQHQTSTLVKYLFAQKGFNTVYDDELPQDLASDRCKGLMVRLVDNSSMFTTKTALALIDCNKQEVFLTEEGKSKKKDYRESYGEAIKRAFNSLASVNYSYAPKADEKASETVTISFDNDVKTVEGAASTQVKKEPMVEQIATKDEQSFKDRRPIESEYKKEKASSEKVVEELATAEEQKYSSKEPQPSDYVKASSETAAKISGAVLYAQELPNGYQLVDSSPKIQLKIFKSSMPNVYIAKSDDRDGVVYTSDGQWFFEYHEGDQIVREALNIKF